MNRLSSAQRRQQIMEAALDILYQEGSHKLTMRNLAHKISLTEAAIYRHFQGKEDLAQHLVERACDPSLLENLRGEQPLAALNALLFRQLKRLDKEPLLSAVTEQEGLFREYPALQKRLQAQRAARRNLIMALVKQGQEDGLFNSSIDGESFALLFMGALRMSVLQWKEAGFAYSLLQEGQKLMGQFELFLKGGL